MKPINPVASQHSLVSAAYTGLKPKPAVGDAMNAYTARWHEGAASQVSLKNGFTIRYLKTGSGPNLLLMHTLRTQLDYFQKLIPLLENHFTVYAIDLPGHGWSSINAGVDYTEPLLRQSVVEFIEALGLDELTLAGDSVGAVLSLTVSVELAGRVIRAIPINLYDYDEGVERANRIAKVIIGTYRLPVLGRIVSNMENGPVLGAILRGGFHDGKNLPSDLLSEFRRVGRRRGYPRMARSLFSSLASFIAARKLYDRVSVPTTLVYGEDDWSKPVERAANFEFLREAGMVTLKNTGHFASLEQPEKIAEILLKN